MRIAIVDVGTNTTRLLIADVEDARVQGEVVRVGRVTRLGAEVDRNGHLSPDALEREHTVLDEYRRTIDEHEAQRAVAVMTSAVRDAADGAHFAQDVAERYGFDVRVLSGDEEARLTYRGATDELDSEATETTLVVDIGGGSTEIVVGRGRRPGFHVSTQAGVVRQADRHIRTDPPTQAELSAFAADVRATLHDAVPERWRTGVERALAVAGTPTSLAAIALSLEPYDPKAVHGYQISRYVRDEIAARLGQLPLSERRQIRGLHPDRAITIVPGIAILTEVMELFDLDAVEVSEHDILRGAALTFTASGG